jgi:hypothetical protein
MAAQGTDVLPSDLRTAPVVDRHREEIALELRARGLSVRTDVGLSDFKVDLAVAPADAPDEPVMAVLLDGPSWARRRTVADRDGLPVEVLAGMLRWPVVERVWLPSWLASRDEVVERLVAAVQAGVDGVVAEPEPEPQPLATVTRLPLPIATAPEPGKVAALRSAVSAAVAAPVPTAPKPSPKKRRPTTVAGPTGLEGEAPFKAWAPKTAGEKDVLDALPDSKAARAVRRVMEAGIRTEGPIHVDRLTRLTAGAFGLSRVTDARKASLLALLPPSAIEGDVCWPRDLDRPWSGFRRQATSSERPLDHVPVEEVGNAMVAMCRASAGMARDELLTAAAQVFGYKRRTPSLTPALERALHRVVERGRLVEQPSGLLTAL